MRKIIFFLSLVCFGLMSCTKEKTDYTGETETVIPGTRDFKEAVLIHNGDYDVSIEAINGLFYTGYNDIRIRVKKEQNNVTAEVQSATFLPILSNTNATNNSSCPHQYELVKNVDNNYFTGYAVFTSETGVDKIWDLYLSFSVDGKVVQMKQTISVKIQDNKNLNMVSFMGKDSEQYIIALVAPWKPSVGENKLIAGIYKYDKPTSAASGSFPDPSQFSYSIPQDYILQLDPRMPDPSMGNHSSPNNKDLTQESDGFYEGIVNYTMTGNWTLNFILSNQVGRILKGTVVPTDFTPGVEGVKSELYIDILF